MVTKIHENVIKEVAPQSKGEHCAPGVTMTAIAAEHEQSTVCIAFLLTTLFVGTIMLLLLLHRPVAVYQVCGCYTLCQKFAMKQLNCGFLSQKLFHLSSVNNVSYNK